MQVILDSSFARRGSAPIRGEKKGELRDWTTFTYENGAIRVRKIDEIQFLDVIAMRTITPSIVIARYLKEIQLF